MRRGSGSRVRIRAAVRSDAQGLAPLLGELGYPIDGPTLAGRLDRLLADPSVGVYVAERDARILGAASVHVLSLLERAPLARLSAIVVAEAERGRGIGRLLVDRVEQAARASNCDRLEVTSGDWRHDAHAFYRRLGFEQESQRFLRSVGAAGE